MKVWGSCSREKFFDYHRNSPCIFLKLNKIYGWVPEYYHDPRDLPHDMPLQLKYHIGNITEPNKVCLVLNFGITSFFSLYPTW